MPTVHTRNYCPVQKVWKRSVRGCDGLLCYDDVCRSYIGKRFHAALVMVKCLSAAITQRQTEVDGPHKRGRSGVSVRHGQSCAKYNG